MIDAKTHAIQELEKAEEAARAVRIPGLDLMNAHLKVLIGDEEFAKAALDILELGRAFSKEVPDDVSRAIGASFDALLASTSTTRLYIMGDRLSTMHAIVCRFHDVIADVIVSRIPADVIIDLDNSLSH